MFGWPRFKVDFHANLICSYLYCPVAAVFLLMKYIAAHMYTAAVICRFDCFTRLCMHDHNILSYDIYVYALPYTAACSTDNGRLSPRADSCSPRQNNRISRLYTAVHAGTPIIYRCYNNTYICAREFTSFYRLQYASSSAFLVRIAQ